MSATTSPKVSVIVPVHNTAPWLDRCVESVRAPVSYTHLTLPTTNFV